MSASASNDVKEVSLLKSGTKRESTCWCGGGLGVNTQRFGFKGGELRLSTMGSRGTVEKILEGDGRAHKVELSGKTARCVTCWLVGWRRIVTPGAKGGPVIHLFP
jgi:hypothetical protein